MADFSKIVSHLSDPKTVSGFESEDDLMSYLDEQLKVLEKLPSFAGGDKGIERIKAEAGYTWHKQQGDMSAEELEDYRDRMTSGDSSDSNAIDETRKAQGVWEDLAGEIPGADDLKLDADDLLTYSPGAELDYSDALAELTMPYERGTRSAVAGMDATGRDAQTEALDYWSSLVSGGGRDAVSDAQYESRRRDAEQAARAQREAALQNANERGQGGGGAELIAEMMAARDVGRNASEGALESSAMAQQRRDNAAGAMGSQGAQLYGQDMQRSGMEDDWNQVMGNWWSQLGVNRSNLEGEQANANWNRQNFTNDQNTSMLNDVVYQNATIPEREFGLKTAVAAGKTGQYNAGAGQWDSQANRDMAREQAAKQAPWQAIGFAGNAAANVGQTIGMLKDGAKKMKEKK